VIGTQILGTVDMIVGLATTADALPGSSRRSARFSASATHPGGQDDDFTVRDLTTRSAEARRTRAR